MTSIRQTVREHSSGKGLEPYMVTAGGRILCLRCTARSTRSKQQCKKPALKVSRTQKCGFHGGRPHSEQTLRTIAKTNTIHGERTNAARQQHQAESVLLHEIEDMLHLFGWAEGPRIRGRKPDGYKGVLTVEDAIRMVGERVLHTNFTVKRAR